MSTVNKKALLIQPLLWLLLSVIFTSVLAVLLFRRLPITGAVDMHVHDTMFVINGWLILLPLFLLVAFLFAFIFGNRNSVGSRRNNPTTITTGICFIVVTAALSGSFLSKNVDHETGRVVFFYFACYTGSCSNSIPAGVFSLAEIQAERRFKPKVIP